MFVNHCLIFVFDLVRQIMQNSKPYIVYVTKRSENTPGRADQAELTQGQVDSGAYLTSGQADPLPFWAPKTNV